MSSEFKSGIGADFRQRELGLIPHRSTRGPLPRNLGAFCGQIAPMVSVLPVVPVRKYCAVYYLAHDSYHGMEEVIGSIPIRSTKSFQAFSKFPLSPFGSNLAANFKTFLAEGSEVAFPPFPVAGSRSRVLPVMFTRSLWFGCCLAGIEERVPDAADCGPLVPVPINSK